MQLSLNFVQTPPRPETAVWERLDDQQRQVVVHRLARCWSKPPSRAAWPASISSRWRMYLVNVGSGAAKLDAIRAHRLEAERTKRLEMLRAPEWLDWSRNSGADHIAQEIGVDPTRLHEPLSEAVERHLRQLAEEATT